MLQTQVGEMETIHPLGHFRLVQVAEEVGKQMLAGKPVVVAAEPEELVAELRLPERAELHHRDLGAGTGVLAEVLDQAAEGWGRKLLT